MTQRDPPDNGRPEIHRPEIRQPASVRASIVALPMIPLAPTTMACFVMISPEREMRKWQLSGSSARRR